MSKERGMNLTFRIPSDSTPNTQLYKYNEPQFDQIVFLAPQAKGVYRRIEKKYAVYLKHLFIAFSYPHAQL